MTDLTNAPVQGGPSIIEPTVGRVVLFHPVDHTEDRPVTHAAIVAGVHNDRLVNLACFDSAGVGYPRQHVRLVQPGDRHRPESGPFCEWMGYQVGQAAKTEELQQALAEATGDNPAAVDDGAPGPVLAEEGPAGGEVLGE